MNIWVHVSLSIMVYSQRRQWHATPVLLPGKSHGRRSLGGCSPWGLEESYTTERLHFHFPLSCIGEGNGNPFQCSCLENPRDGGAWWAAISGVTQSRTRLKWLSSSSSSSQRCFRDIGRKTLTIKMNLFGPEFFIIFILGLRINFFFKEVWLLSFWPDFQISHLPVLPGL